jgi:hypothetical protein
MDFAILPPEINSGRMYAGPGSGPMLAAAAAWDGLERSLRCIVGQVGLGRVRWGWPLQNPWPYRPRSSRVPGCRPGSAGFRAGSARFHQRTHVQTPPPQEVPRRIN